ncbi:hypothetical protein B7494_g7136 [Chlorociboria aeruginascens]|nr:hypothetical protein B7494_g7136 [Chlorociboria aeruginascens]
MKFTAAIASALLLANAAWASPLAARAAAAGVQLRRRSGLKIPVNASAEYASTSESTNWSGAVISSSGVTEVTGTFTIPRPSPPSGGSSRTEYCGAAWVGIDGDTCQSGLIQTGVFWCVQNGAYSYEAWYEYLDAASIAYNGISVSSGDSVTVTVTKTSSTGGVTTLSSGGTTVSHTFTRQTDGTLCGYDADWIVEDFESGSSLVPFADFGTVTFTGASAVIGGVTETPGGDSANTIVLVSSSDRTLTDTTISGSSVTISYV